MVERLMLESVDILADSNAALLQGHQEGDQVGLSFLMQQKVFVAVFPLHDGDLHIDEENKKRKPISLWPLRPWLYETWARPGRWFKEQPIDQVRQYFGEKIALYFAWLGFYTKMLIPFSILGLIVFIYGIFSVSSNVLVKEVCEDTKTVICRACPAALCSYTWLNSSCTYAKINQVFSNYSTLGYAFLSSLWAIVFLEFWKREQARLTAKWDSFDMAVEFGPPRPEYQTAAKERRRNPITKEWEPYIPPKSIWQNFVFSMGGIFMMIIMVFGVIAGVTIYKSVMAVVFYNTHNPTIDAAGAPTVATFTASLINAITIMILEKVYGSLAWKFTEREYPRTEDDFEKSYTYKMFMFQFINNYATLFYLAFIQNYVGGDPKTNSIFTDKCPPVGCMFTVTSQLLIILTLKQIINNVMEIGAPIVKNWLNRRTNVASTEDNQYTRWEKDFDLQALPPLSLFGEYFEMVMQFGFVTMFVAAFPLAPLFALLNNVVEIRLDAYKFVGESRRAIPHRAPDIGTWYELLEVVTRIAVITNGLIIAFTTDLIDQIVYQVHYSPNGTMDNYMKFVLSIFEISEWHKPDLSYDSSLDRNITFCSYRGYYNPPRGYQLESMGVNRSEHLADAGLVEKLLVPPYLYSSVWWRTMVVKLGFVLIFEHAVFGIQSFLQYVIPDVPEDVELHNHRNRYVSKVGAKLVQSTREQLKLSQGKGSGTGETVSMGYSLGHSQSRSRSPSRSIASLPLRPDDSITGGAEGLSPTHDMRPDRPDPDRDAVNYEFNPPMDSGSVVSNSSLFGRGRSPSPIYQQFQEQQPIPPPKKGKSKGLRLFKPKKIDKS